MHPRDGRRINSAKYLNNVNPRASDRPRQVVLAAFETNTRHSADLKAAPLYTARHAEPEAGMEIPMPLFRHPPSQFGHVKHCNGPKVFPPAG